MAALGGSRHALINLSTQIDIPPIIKKSLSPATGYFGHKDEQSHHLNTFYVSFASVCALQMGAFCILQNFFQRNFCFRPAFEKVVCIITRKGEVLPPFGRKEVNTMTPNRREFEKQCTFQKFCKSVLHNEACNAHEEIRRRRVREVTFSDLALYEERQLYTVDKYFQDEEAEPSYQMAGKEITPKLLLEAIRALPEERRKIVLLYYFEGLTDIEIAKQLNISRSTVQYRRTSSFEQLKKYLEENADEWIEW